MHGFTYCVLLLLTLSSLFLYLFSYRRTASLSNLQDSQSVPSWVRSSHLKLYLMCLAIEWLQLPYLFRLYADYCIFNHINIAILYIIGVVLTPILMPTVSLIVEHFGPSFSLTFFSTLTAFSILLKPVLNYKLQMLSRIMNSISTPALLLCIDEWYSSELAKSTVYQKVGKPNDRVSRTYNSIFQLAVSFVAIVSGLAADFVAKFLNLGYVAPFLTALFPVVTALYVNYKNRVSSNATRYIHKPTINRSLSTLETPECLCGSPSQHRRTLRCFYLGVCDTLSTVKYRSPFMLLVPILQSLIDCTIYVFTFSWTPLLELSVKKGSTELANLPLGAISSCFMGGIIIGGLIFQILSTYRVLPTKLLVCVSGLIILLNLLLSLYSPLRHQHPWLCFLTLITLEIVYGLYTPCIQWLRDNILPLEISHNKFHSQVFDCVVRTPMNLLIIFLILVPLTPKTIRVDELMTSFTNRPEAVHFYLINPRKLFLASSLLAVFSLVISKVIESKLATQLVHSGRFVHSRFQYVTNEV